MDLHETPSQTIGPFHHRALVSPGAAELVDAAAPGAIVVHGIVRDGEDAPVTDALVELWQADPGGVHPDGRTVEPDGSTGFGGFGRTATDDSGGYRFVTVKPGAVGGEAPHLHLRIFARGLLTGLDTRLYFDDESAANAADAVLGLVDADRRGTLIARSCGLGEFELDLRLQGPEETVFLAF